MRDAHGGVEDAYCKGTDRKGIGNIISEGNNLGEGGEKGEKVVRI